MNRLSPLLLAVVLTAATGACTAGSGEPTFVSPPAEQTGAEADHLRRALITPDDLPGAYQPWPPLVVAEDPPRSDRPDCVGMLDSLTDVPQDPGVVAVQAGFAVSDFDGRVQHLLRRYPAGGAAERFTEAVRLLDGCRRFTLTYQDGAELVETVESGYLAVDTPAAVALWSARIDVEWAGGAQRGITVLMQTGDVLAILHFLDADPVDPQWASMVTGRLAARLADQVPR